MVSGERKIMSATDMGFGVGLAIWMACIARVVLSNRVAGVPKGLWLVGVALCPLLLVAFLLCVEYRRPTPGCPVT
jgi:hypothetical protein